MGLCLVCHHHVMNERTSYVQYDAKKTFTLQKKPQKMSSMILTGIFQHIPLFLRLALKKSIFFFAIIWYILKNKKGLFQH